MSSTSNWGECVGVGDQGLPDLQGLGESVGVFEDQALPYGISKAVVSVLASVMDR